MATTEEVSVPFSTIILAAGISKRMFSKTPKIVYRILGKPVIEFVVDVAQEVGSKEIVIVVGKNHSEIKQILGKNVIYAVQETPMGTGDAARKGIAKVSNPHILILYGDVPLLKKETILSMITNHLHTGSDLSILTCEVHDPAGYGRIVRNSGNQIKKIVEHADANREELKINEINTGIYFGSKNLISNALMHIKADNKQKEFYLTDIVHYLIKKKKKVTGFKIRDEEQIMGINTKSELARVRDIIKKRWLDELMRKGVYIEDPTTTNIDLSVQFGKYVTVRPFTLIEGNTCIKDNAVIGPFAWIRDGTKKKIRKTMG